jgi:hypothetical protein
MMDLSNISIVEPGFAFEPTHDGDFLLVRFSGNADMNAVRTLSSCLKRLHEEAVRLTVREVRCDFSGLYFMNSSCFKSFVSWISSVEGLEPQARYTIRLRSNRQLHWQKRSLEALRCLAEDIVFIETGG